jgi:glycine dehydrogenase subunit 2
MTTAQTHEPVSVSAPAAPETKVHRRGERPVEPTIFEKSSPGARAFSLPDLDVEETSVPTDVLGDQPDWPELGMPEVIRHYTHLSQRNFCIDGEFYPLGSCTMKFNPRINEFAAALPGFSQIHPLQDDEDVQGALRLVYETRRMLEEIAGLAEASLQPAAGAHGEYTALKVIRAYFVDRGETQRTKVLAPANAHGTNMASCTMCGANSILVKSDDGYTDIDDLRRIIEKEGPETIMALMITNPNTAGLFDGHIAELAAIIHEAGGLVYLDGANMNAILGKTRPGEFGADAMHYNTHKTFSTPHGCGGPGSGPIVVRDFLAPYLPRPQVVKREDGAFALDFDRPQSIGKVRSFFGQFGVLVRCWTYIRACGPKGLREVAEQSVISANYLAARLADRYEMPFFNPKKGQHAAHEFVTVPQSLLDRGVTLNDIAKRLIDYGVHPPTMHWPVKNCLMVEPTETESLATLDRFVAVMNAIADQIQQEPESLQRAPEDAVVDRLDIVAGDRHPVVTAPRG